MIDNYEREERLAIRVAGGMTEREAVALTDAEAQSKSMFKRVAEIAKHLREHAAPVPLTIPKNAPIIDRKTLSTGDAL